MREIRTSGSEGGGTQPNASFLPLLSREPRLAARPRPAPSLLSLRDPDQRVVRATPDRSEHPVSLRQSRILAHGLRLVPG